MKEARYWEVLSDGKVRCTLCPNTCVILPGGQGVCRVRENREGKLYSRAYGRVTSIGLDPVEKKPLYHFHPGGLVFSIGTYGCNFSCEFCQNWHISQMNPEYTMLSPDDVVKLALGHRKRYENTVGIAYTYNEPTVWWEFVYECARKAKEAGLSNVLVTNGYIAEGPLEELLPYIDALNIDVKAWKEDFYKRVVHGRLDPVLKTVEKSLESSWVEVTYLVIPGENDSEEDVRAMSSWLKSLSPAIPLHLSRYFPAYRFSRPPTPVRTLERLREVAMENLYYVYVGNVWKKGYADTLCPKCGEVLLERGALQLEASHLKDGLCPACNRPLDVKGTVWMP
ncbi:MAG TPA: AmmeMemoRadiSam system radical SAM enzyme [Firmicutes bacterium]|nr:AmmeMemoRadiSam system radical SAM enzyme [Candidatus Fermentithermobacillaceae bacterium]